MTTSSLPEFDFPNTQEATLGTPLVLEGKAHSVETAELTLRLITETWDGEKSVYMASPHLVMVLDVFVDENSGDDGEPAPLINVTFDAPIAGPEAFFRTDLNDTDLKCDATYGSEAPALEDNRITMSGIEDGQVRLRWTARYEEEGKRLPFLFDGRVTFKGLIGTVKKPADFQSTLAKIAPEWVGLRPKIEEKVDFDEPSAGSERWVNCTISLD